MISSNRLGKAGASARLAVSVSLIALGTFGATSVAAQDAPIVVTGTRIEGVAPVGSSVIPVGREELEEMGASTVNDALRKIPQVVNFGGSDEQTGGATIQNSSLNTFFAKSVNLRGLGTAATLNLVNNHRVAPQGPNGQLYDADNIPGIAIERIEVVADGGSAIYGSDAIGGVVNYITRRPEDTIEARFRAGFADGFEEYIASFAVGKTWDTGGMFFAYEYQDRGALLASDRPDLYNSDLSEFGGGPDPFFSSPGNVQFAVNGPAYGIPSGQDGTSLTFADLLDSPNRQSQWYGADAIPGYNRHSVSGTLTQDIGSFVTFNADGFFSRRNFVLNEAGIDQQITVPNTNPYSPCAPGSVDIADCPADGTLYVPYNFIDSLGPTISSGYEEIWAVSGGFDVDFGSSWKANVSGYYSEDDAYISRTNMVNSTALQRVVSGSAADIDKPADVPFFNPFCDASQFDCNPEATLAHFRAFTDIGSTYELYGGTANINGELFDIGGGSVRLAVGGEYHHDTLSGTGQITNVRGPTVDNPRGIPATNNREVKSVYGEVFVPIVGVDNAMPGVERLEFNAAVRYDDYSDVGGTTNPKFGVNYSPVAGVTFRGSYGTSFRAPSLVDVNKYATAGFLIRSATGDAIGLSPGDNTFTYTYPAGGNPDLSPETAETWSVGMDIDSDLVPGVTASLTYYNITYENKIDTATFNAPIAAVLNSGIYDDFIVFNPDFFPDKATMSIDEYVAYWDSLQDPFLPVLGPIPGGDPANLIAIIDARRNNQGVVKTDGFDFSFNYDIEGGFADFNIGTQFNYILHYKTAPVAAATLRDEVNHFGYPAQFVGRLELGMDVGGFSGTAFINYVNGREITRDFLSPSVPDQYLDIDSYTTVDLTLTYDFEDSDLPFANGLSLSVTAQNLFDAKPPLVVNAGEYAIRFDPSYSSSIGRFVAVSVAKKFW